ncbi:hypothetical protein KUTeg_012553 [Tegillarca granosa]|uniref:C2H2-type domain-containing protein n=1 Tax=Tegillarca granosa TaxID=220873 RepID=A0ABQ9EZX4_TEGGR|nr:hypothetical protein KUTeg_012553 [Tegillarca granosa]
MENTTDISPVPLVQIKVEPLSPSHYSNNEPEQPLNLAQSASTPITRENHTTDKNIYQGIQNTTGSHSMNGSPSLHMAYNVDANNYSKNGDLNMNMPYSGIPTNSTYGLAQQNSANMYLTEKSTGAANMMYGGYGYDLPGMTGEMMDSGFSDENFNVKNGGGPRSGSKRSNLPKRYKCAMCAYKTRYKSDLNRHVRKHAVATFNCEICNMPFKTVGNVEFHKRKEHADMLESPSVDALKYKCSHCTYGTMYSSDLTRHVRKHYVAKFHCNSCNKPFMTSGSLVHHKRSVHNMNDVEVVMGMGGVESVNQMDITTLREETAEVEGNQNAGEQINGNAGMEMENQTKKSDDNVENGSDTPKTTAENLNGNQIGVADTKNSDNAGEAEKEMDTQSNDGEKETYTYEEPDRETEISITIDRSDNEIISKHTCPYCDKSFGRKMVLEYHLRNIHKMKNGGNGMFVEYPDDYELALDMSIQELENSTSDATPSNSLGMYNKPRHQCPFCAYATNYKSTYDRHVKKHDLECHICNVCRMPFITFGHLQRHIRDNHPDHVQPISKKEVTVDKHKCSYCAFEAESLPSLQAHCESEHNKVVGVSPQQFSQPRKKHIGLKGPPTGKNNRRASLDDSADEDELNSKPMLSWKHQRTNQSLEEGVAMHPPTSGRYAKLVSDFDDFSLRPFACSLCFYRTGSVEQLVKHAENHLTGCNSDHIPDTARFSSHWFDQAVNLQNFGLVQPFYSPSRTNNNQTYDGQFYGQNEQVGSQGQAASGQSAQQVYKQHYQVKQSNSGTKLTLKSIPTNEVQVKQEKIQKPGPAFSKQTSGNLMAKALQGNQTAMTESELNKKLDKIIPTFSVHYRKDKTNKTRPYLCLLCRKRFRHLTLLKQHFKQCHSESQVNSSRTYTCNICKKVFNSPMILQNHYDLNH